MNIKNIELQNFRNYGALNLAFKGDINIFVGNNAQGKTNLLEALYLCSVGRSFRTKKDAEMIRFGEKFFRVSLDAEKEEEELKIEIAVSENQKAVKVNGRKLKKSSELVENLYCVVFSPEDLKLVKDGPEKRRRFMDLELCRINPLYYAELLKYKRALIQKNNLLKSLKFEGLSKESEEALDVWDELIAESGFKITRLRKDFLEELSEISAEIHERLSGGREKAKSSYEANISAEDKGEFYDFLLKGRSEDIKNGSSGSGPQRDDIAFSVNGVDLRYYGSQGQQRTAALSLKLSESELIKRKTGESAVLLLDDVLSELDGERQSFLISSFGENQLFITAADFSSELEKRLPEGKLFSVCEGKVSEGI